MQQQWWLVYVRWGNGYRETIRCLEPDKLDGRERCWVMACLPVPNVTVRLGR